MPNVTRRSVLAGVTASSLLVSATMRKWKVIVTGGHPGDPEYGCGGTIARYTAAGHDVALLYLNRGEYGCKGKSPDACGELRSIEAQRACRIVGARPLFFGQIDGHAVVDNASYEAMRKLLEAEAPDVLFTQWPIDGHADHRAISALTYDAWLARKSKCAFYYYEVSDGEDTLMFSPTDYVDISSTESLKRSACYAHASQTPDRYYALQTQVARFRGVESGYSEAEAFIRHVHSPRGFLA